jgi:uncharacterized CHY-type Zn-finger protein
MSIHSVICGHCGQEISYTVYRSCKLCAWPVCAECAKDPYCPRRKEVYSDGEETQDKKPSPAS